MRNEIVKLAQSWVGRNEADGTHKYIIDIYNAHKPLARNYKVKYTDSWCATTISALAIKLDMVDIIPKECGCQQMIALFKKIGCWTENKDYRPNIGDIVFYDWEGNGWSDHVGVVEKVTGSVITVIEGNYKNSVARRRIAIGSRDICGYGLPKYKVHTSASSTKNIDAIAKEVIEGKWGSGDDRKKRLIASGYDYNAVQVLVNQMLSGGCYKAYTGQSKQIDIVFRGSGVPEKYIGNVMKRKPVATANGISNYKGTLAQNLQLVSLAKNGRLKRV